MGLELTKAPSVEPITLAEAKSFLRIDTTDEDSLINTLISSARSMCEEFTQRAFIKQTWDLWLDRFPFGKSEKVWEGVLQAHRNILNEETRNITIPRPPLLSVIHLQTYDDANVATTFTANDYVVDNVSQPGRIILENGATWPTDLRSGHAINVQFQAGYGGQASKVPAQIRHAILLTTAKLYECRGDQCEEADMPKLAKQALSTFRVHSLGGMNLL